MPPGKCRFFYYEVTAEDSNRKGVSFDGLLEKHNFLSAKITVKRNSGRNYSLEFEKHPTDNKYYYGRILRTKRDTEFFHTNGNVTESLSSKLKDPNGETGMIKYDIVNFAFTVKDGTIYILMQQGFQYPGIGVFLDYLAELTKGEGFKFKHRIMPKPKQLSPLKKVFDKKLKVVSMHFRKEPDLPDNAVVEEILKRIATPPEYVLNIEFILRKPKKDSVFMPVKDYLCNFFGIKSNKNDVLDTMLQIDFPSILTVFDITAFDENPAISTTEDILKSFENEDLDIDKTTLENFKSIGQELCTYLKDKLAEINAG